MSCTASNGDSLLSSKTHIAGWECESTLLYVVVLAFTVCLQIVRNKIWAISGQAGREALHTSRGSPERSHYILVLLWYTFLSTTLHIVNILLILGSNLGVLLSVLAGNLLGTWYAYAFQAADKHRTSEELLNMVKKYQQLKTKASRGYLVHEESDMLNKLNETKQVLKEFVFNDEDPVEVVYADSKPLDFKFRR